VKFYDCQMAPNPRRVRIFIREKGLEIPTEEVNILEGANLQPGYLAVNPRGLVPSLALDDGTVIDEAPAICTYLEALHPDPPLLGTDPVEKATILSWERHMELDGMNAAGEFFRNSMPTMADRGLPGRSGDAQIAGLVERGKRSVGIFYDRLEKRLAESAFVGGKDFSMADITGLCVVDFATFAGMPIPEGYEHTKRWHHTVSARPSAAG